MISYVLHRLDPTLSPGWDGSARRLSGKAARERPRNPHADYWDVLTKVKRG